MLWDKLVVPTQKDFPELSVALRLLFRERPKRQNTNEQNQETDLEKLWRWKTETSQTEDENIGEKLVAAAGMEAQSKTEEDLERRFLQEHSKHFREQVRAARVLDAEVAGGEKKSFANSLLVHSDVLSDFCDKSVRDPISENKDFSALSQNVGPLGFL